MNEVAHILSAIAQGDRPTSALAVADELAKLLADLSEPRTRRSGVSGLSQPLTSLRRVRGSENKRARHGRRTPIKAMPLTALELVYHPEYKDMLRSLKGLKTINHKSVAEFWKEVRGK